MVYPSQFLIHLNSDDYTDYCQTSHEVDLLEVFNKWDIPKLIALLSTIQDIYSIGVRINHKIVFVLTTVV